MNTNNNPNHQFADDNTASDHEQVHPDTYDTRPERDMEEDFGGDDDFEDDDQLEDEENDLDESNADERRDWGDVDPAGGEAPTSPGSAV